MDQVKSDSSPKPKLNRTLIAFYAVFATKLMKNCYMAKLAAAIPWPPWPKVISWPHGQIGWSDSMAAMAKMAAANPWPPWVSRVPQGLMVGFTAYKGLNRARNTLRDYNLH